MEICYSSTKKQIHLACKNLSFCIFLKVVWLSSAVAAWAARVHPSLRKGCSFAGEMGNQLRGQAMDHGGERNSQPKKAPFCSPKAREVYDGPFSAETGALKWVICTKG